MTVDTPVWECFTTETSDSCCRCRCLNRNRNRGHAGRNSLVRLDPAARACRAIPASGERYLVNACRVRETRPPGRPSTRWTSHRRCRHRIAAPTRFTTTTRTPTTNLFAAPIFVLLIADRVEAGRCAGGDIGDALMTTAALAKGISGVAKSLSRQAEGLVPPARTGYSPSGAKKALSSANSCSSSLACSGYSKCPARRIIRCLSPGIALWIANWPGG